MAKRTPEPPPGLVSAWRNAVLLAALFLALNAGGAPLRLALRYERDAVLAGQAWRLLTAHAVHLGWTHAALNAAGVLLCCALAPALFAHARRLLPQLLALAAGTGLLLLAVSPQVPDYVGFSGVLYGLFVLGLAPQAERRDPVAVAALAVLALWLAWQLLAGPAASEERLIGGTIVSVAHAWGVLTALVLLAVGWRTGAMQRRPPG